MPIWSQTLCNSRIQISSSCFFQGWSRRVRRISHHLPGSWAHLVTLNMLKDCNLRMYLGICRGCRRRTCDSPAPSLCCKYWKESRSLPLPTTWDVHFWRCRWTCLTPANGCKFSSAFVESCKEMEILWLHFWHSSHCQIFWLSLYDYNTDLPAYNDTVYSDISLTVTLLTCPKWLVCY